MRCMKVLEGTSQTENQCIQQFALCFYLGPMSSICSVVVFLRQLSTFVILCHVLQCPRSYPRAICPFGAIVKLQGMVANCAAEVILVNWRDANMSVPFFCKWVPGLQSLNVFPNVGACLPLSWGVLTEPSESNECQRKKLSNSYQYYSCKTLSRSNSINGNNNSNSNSNKSRSKRSSINNSINNL
jgi:hypothetical protein